MEEYGNKSWKENTEKKKTAKKAIIIAFCTLCAAVIFTLIVSVPRNAIVEDVTTEKDAAIDVNSVDELVSYEAPEGYKSSEIAAIEDTNGAVIQKSWTDKDSVLEINIESYKGKGVAGEGWSVDSYEKTGYYNLGEYKLKDGSSAYIASEAEDENSTETAHLIADIQIGDYVVREEIYSSTDEDGSLIKGPLSEEEKNEFYKLLDSTSVKKK